MIVEHPRIQTTWHGEREHAQCNLCGRHDAVKARGQLICGVPGPTVGARAACAANPADYMVQLKLFSKEPLAQIVRAGDADFARIVRWSFFAMVEAEEKRVSSKNVDDMLKSDDENIKRLLGVTPGLGKALGVDDRWVYNIVKQVGNYGEVFDRNLGAASPLKVARGLNALWTEGGI